MVAGSCASTVGTFTSAVLKLRGTAQLVCIDQDGAPAWTQAPDSVRADVSGVQGRRGEHRAGREAPLERNVSPLLLVGLTAF